MVDTPRRKPRVNIERILAVAADPEMLVAGRRTSFVVEVLRAWGEPMSIAELTELLEWRRQTVRDALSHAVADGRAGFTGNNQARRFYADPDITPTLIPNTPPTEENP